VIRHVEIDFSFFFFLEERFHAIQPIHRRRAAVNESRRLPERREHQPLGLAKAECRTLELKKPEARGALKSIFGLTISFFRETKSFASIALRTSLKGRKQSIRKRGMKGKETTEPEERLVELSAH
jgi:hypothetical protein